MEKGKKWVPITNVVNDLLRDEKRKGVRNLFFNFNPPLKRKASPRENQRTPTHSYSSQISLPASRHR